MISVDWLLFIVYRHKSEVYQRFVEYIHLMENQTGKKIKLVQCDNGTEYLNKDFYKLAKDKGIYLRSCPLYTYELNGVAERYNRTIMNRARCLLSEAKLPKIYWPECVYKAAYLLLQKLIKPVMKFFSTELLMFQIYKFMEVQLLLEFLKFQEHPNLIQNQLKAY